MTVVVGLDGSGGAVEALRFAVEEARIRGVAVKAVTAWHVPPAAYEGGWATVPLDLDEYRKLAERSLGRSLDESGIDRSGVQQVVSFAAAIGKAFERLIVRRKLDGFIAGSKSTGVAASTPATSGSRTLSPFAS